MSIWQSWILSIVKLIQGRKARFLELSAVNIVMDWIHLAKCAFKVNSFVKFIYGTQQWLVLQKKNFFDKVILDWKLRWFLVHVSYQLKALDPIFVILLTYSL